LSAQPVGCDLVRVSRDPAKDADPVRSIIDEPRDAPVLDRLGDLLSEFTYYFGSFAYKILTGVFVITSVYLDELISRKVEGNRPVIRFCIRPTHEDKRQAEPMPEAKLVERIRVVIREVRDDDIGFIKIRLDLVGDVPALWVVDRPSHVILVA